MGIKVQFNPSTGKVIFNSNLGKVQVVTGIFNGNVGFPCTDCGSEITPKFIKVTFANIIYAANTCYNCSNFDPDVSYTGMFDPNNSYVLEQITIPAMRACAWQLKWTIPTATRTTWTSTDGDCDGTPTVISSTEATVVVVRSGSNVETVFGIGLVAGYLDSYIGTATSGCVYGSYNNQLPTFMGCNTQGHSGTVLIEAP